MTQSLNDTHDIRVLLSASSRCYLGRRFLEESAEKVWKKCEVGLRGSGTAARLQ